MTIECGALGERMPAVVAGLDRWSEGEASHLMACPACAAEWRLVGMARHLGAGAAAELDVSRLTQGVLAGVARRNRVARRRRTGWLVGLAAAALVLVVWRGRSAGDEFAQAGPAAEFHLPLAELEALEAPLLEQLLDALELPVSEGTTIEGPSLGDLDDSQLERVLRSLEG